MEYLPVECTACELQGLTDWPDKQNNFCSNHIWKKNCLYILINVNIIYRCLQSYATSTL